MRMFVNHTVAALLLASGLFTSTLIYADSRPTVGIVDFKSSITTKWWRGYIGKDMADMLANELAGTKKFNVVERQKISAVVTEQDLASAGRVRKGTGASTGNLTGAKYLVTGTVTSYEENTSDTKGALTVMGIRVGGSKGKAYITVDLRIIDSSTGVVVDHRTVEANSGKFGLNLGFRKFGLGGKVDHEQKTPAMKAVRAVIMEISDYLVCSMVDDDDCISDYDAKEQRRREKTRESITLE